MELDNKGVIFLDFKKSMGKGYNAEDVKAYINAYEAEFESKYLELECTIENLSKEIESLKQELEPMLDNEAEYQRMEAEIKETLLNVYFDSTNAYFEANQGFCDQEEELNNKVYSREMELSNVRQVTDQLCKEIELLTKGYDQVLKGENNT